MKKLLKKPPLPFRGNKGKWFNEIKDIISKIEANDITVVDVFGGSGLISYWIKNIRPEWTVIYNDFDNYELRLNNIDKTELLRLKILEILTKNNDNNHNKALKDETTNEIKELIKTMNDNQEYIDIQTLTSWICFSGRRLENIDALLKEPHLYSRTPKEAINKEIYKDYLKDINIVRFDASDYESFINNLNLVDITKTLFILDPPYLYTETSGYSSNIAREWFDLKASVGLFRYFVNEHSLIFFSSDKSGLLETFNLNCSIFNKDSLIIKPDEIIYKKTPSGCCNYKMNEYLIYRI